MTIVPTAEVWWLRVVETFYYSLPLLGQLVTATIVNVSVFLLGRATANRVWKIRLTRAQLLNDLYVKEQIIDGLNVDLEKLRTLVARSERLKDYENIRAAAKTIIGVAQDLVIPADKPNVMDGMRRYTMQELSPNGNGKRSGS